MVTTVATVVASAFVGGCMAPPTTLTEQRVESFDAALVDATHPFDASAASDASASDASAVFDAAPAFDAALAFDAAPAVDAAIETCDDLEGPALASLCGVCGVVECGPTGLQCEDSAACAAFEQVLSFDVDMSGGLTVHGGGLALGDIDGDGDVDGAFAGPDRLRVYLGDGAGGFTEVVNAIALSPGKVAAVTMVDYDGDDDLDLFVTADTPTPGLHLYNNDGTGAYVDVTDAMAFPATASPRGVAWADYDGDGWLDVYVAGYYDAPSLLLRNLEGTGFEDMAASYGLANPSHAEFQPVWFDYDSDGDLDLFVTVDRGSIFEIPPQLYRNDGVNGFVSVGSASGFSAPIDGMGATVGDVDGDGDFDLFVTNTGWTYSEGQMLYINNGDATFTTSSSAWGVSVTDRVGWGAEFFDFDNDGDLDLAMAAQPTSSAWFGENWGAGFFDLSQTAGLPTSPQNGLATADFDGDGRLDIGWLSKTIPAPGESNTVVGAELFRNAMPSPGHWLRLELSSDAPNRHAIGATVTVLVGTKEYVRLVSSGSAFLSSSDRIVHVGLGVADLVDAIEIRWPDGTTTTHLGPIATDRRLLVTRNDLVESTQ